jgi:multiple sugar transport system permease protein
MTNGGPGYDTSTFMVSTIKTAFQYNDFGLASALAVVLMLIVIIGTFIQNKFFKVRGF